MLPGFNLRKIIESLLVVAVAAIAVAELPALAAVLVGYVIYRFMNILVLPKAGLITKLLLTALIIFSLNTIVGFVAWVFKVDLTLQALTIIYAVVAIVLALVGGAPKKSSLPLIPKHELFALLLSLALFWLTFSPLSPQHDAITSTRVITTGGDNISHLEFIRTVDANNGYIQANFLDLKDTLTSKLIPYPQGWHLNVSFLKKSIEAAKGSPLSVDSSLYLYQLVTGAGLALLAYFFVVLGLNLQRLNTSFSRVFNYLSVAILAALLFLGPFFAFFAIGFQTQIFALALFMGQLLLLIGAVNSQKRRAKQYLIFLSLLLAGGIAYTWFFLWPVALAAIALFLIEMFKLTSLKTALAEARFLITAGLLAMVGLGQLYFLLAFASSSSLLEPGFILEPNNILLVNLLLAVFVFVYYAYRNLQIRLLGQVAAIAAIFALAVLISQLIQVAEPRYFYYKSTYTFILLAALILSVAFAAILSHVSEALAKTRLQAILLVGTFIVAFASLAWTSSSKFFRLYVEQKPYGLSAELSDAILTIVKSNPSDGHKVVAIGSCNRESDIKAMRLATALGGHPHFGQQDVVEAQIKSPKRQVTFKAIKRYIDKEDGLIAVSTDLEMQERLKIYLADDSRRIRFVDLDKARAIKAPQDCPHYLR